MAWDASRPVPWRRLVREWLIYVAVMTALFLLFFRNGSELGVLAGLLVSGPLYLALGYALAKLGYQRKKLRQARGQIDTSADAGGARVASGSAAARPKPAPTRRTGGASTRPGGSRKR